MIAIMDNVDKFLKLFSGFDLVVRPKKRTDKQNKKEFNVTATQAGVAKADLKKELKRLMQEYKKAQKSFKHKKISRQELFDFEWRIFELQEEIRQIEDESSK